MFFKRISVMSCCLLINYCYLDAQFGHTICTENQKENVYDMMASSFYITGLLSFLFCTVNDQKRALGFSLPLWLQSFLRKCTFLLRNSFCRHHDKGAFLQILLPCMPFILKTIVFIYDDVNDFNSVRVMVKRFGIDALR